MIFNLANPASGGSSPWTLIGSGSFTVSTSSTSASSVGTVSCGSALWDESAIIYVRVRDQAGKRAGYFLGSDNFFINFYPANNNTGTFSTGVRIAHRYTTSGVYAETGSTGSTGYGVYARSLTNAGVVQIYARYNGSSSLTINGTYTVEVYKLDYPDGVSPFDI